MEKQYDAPQLEFIRVDFRDVIVTSAFAFEEDKNSDNNVGGIF